MRTPSGVHVEFSASSPDSATGEGNLQAKSIRDPKRLDTYHARRFATNRSRVSNVLQPKPPARPPSRSNRCLAVSKAYTTTCRGPAVGDSFAHRDLVQVSKADGPSGAD
jgi:hypothetical protein